MSPPRPRRAEREYEFGRLSSLGYEAPGTYGSVRALVHGYPHPLVRWHYHDEFELHLIVASRGRAFVGDYIGGFEPGHLVLLGPRLPHNWVSVDVPAGGIAERDLVLQFSDEPLRAAARSIVEIAEILPLLDRASHGVEFVGLGDFARERFERIRHSTGLARFAHFTELLSVLARSRDTRVLSTRLLQGDSGDAGLARMARVVDDITHRFSTGISLAELAGQAGMSESVFSRRFQRATGNTFTDFVNRLRINRACQLLMETDRFVGAISVEVGFRNLANFNRRFLQHKGMTPTEYRRQSDRRFGAADTAPVRATPAAPS